MTWLFWLACVIVLAFGFVVFWGAPYVPSKRKDLAGAFDTLYPLGKKDTLVDIGSGDGIVLRAAARRGARGVGYELNPLLVLISRWLSRADKARITVIPANAWQVRLPDETTVVYAFVVSRDAGKLVKKMTAETARLGRPLSLISYGCELPLGAGMVKTKTLGAHGLYVFTPLHSRKAQV